MTLFEWLSLAAVCALGAMSPGPSLAVVTAHTLGGGRRAGLSAALAHGLGVGLYAVAVVSGLALLVAASPRFFQGVQLAGALFLFYLGGKSLCARGHHRLPGAKYRRQQWGAFVAGLGVAFLNPKLALFFLALFSHFLNADTAATQKVLMVVTVAGIDALWYSGISLLLTRPGIGGRLRTQQRRIDRLFGLLLIALAVWQLSQWLMRQ